MDALLSTHAIWLSILFIAGWTVVMCLKAIGREVEHNEAVHALKVEATVLKMEYDRRIRQRVAEARERMRQTSERRAAKRAAEQAAREAEEAQSQSETLDPPDSAAEVATSPARAAA